MFKYAASASVALVFGALLTTGATAETINYQDFSSPVPLSTFHAVNGHNNGSPDGVWYEDRLSPAGFESTTFDGDDRLALTLSSADTKEIGVHEATQGRRFNTTGANSLSIQMFIPDAYENSIDGRIGGMWGTATNDANETTWAIFDFNDHEFRVWDRIVGWKDVDLPSNLDASDIFGKFVDLKITIDTVANQFIYWIADEFFATTTANGATSFSDVILQGYNVALGPNDTDPAITRTIYFDNFLAEGNVVPIPPALPLFGTGIALMGFIGWRRKRKMAA